MKEHRSQHMLEHQQENRKAVYHPPSLEQLGSLVQITGGDLCGDLDTLFGGSDGWEVCSTPVS